AEVSGQASIRGGACVLEAAKIDGNATVASGIVHGNAHVTEDAYVEGYVFGNAVVLGNAKILDKAHVSGNARIEDDAIVYGEADVTDNAKVFQKGKIGGLRVLNGTQVCGDSCDLQ
ncbi:MAG: hypothetical protein NTV34_01030, partial [Proteobacteria bacterium]|nr:hypothetical protein [Pseudomonadota bacterium]